MRSIFGHIWNVLVAIKDAIVGIFDIRYYMELFNTYHPFIQKAVRGIQ